VKGPSLLFGEVPASFTCKAKLVTPPSRYNNDPHAALTMQLSSELLTDWLSKLEDWALPQVTGREEPRSCVKTNVFMEKTVRVKLTNITRAYDAQGKILKDIPAYEPGTELTLFCGVNLYRLNGAKGLSIRAYAVQT
jgi:hypothetical protein